MPSAHILTTLSILCTIISVVILSHLLANLFGCCFIEPLKSRKDTGQTRWILTFSIASISCLCGQSLIQMAPFLDLSSVHCQIYWSVHLGAYAISKHSMHAFFVRRMAHTFHNSTLAVAKWKLTVFGIFSIVLILICGFFIAQICMDIKAEDTMFGGTYCELETSSTFLELYIAMALITDLVLSFLINSTMVHKLLALVNSQLQVQVATALREAIAS